MNINHFETKEDYVCIWILILNILTRRRIIYLFFLSGTEENELTSHALSHFLSFSPSMGQQPNCEKSPKSHNLYNSNNRSEASIVVPTNLTSSLGKEDVTDSWNIVHPSSPRVPSPTQLSNSNDPHSRALPTNLKSHFPTYSRVVYL